MEDKNLVSVFRRKKTHVTLVMSGSTRRGAGEKGASKNLKGRKEKEHPEQKERSGHENKQGGKTDERKNRENKIAQSGDESRKDHTIQH